MNEIEYAQKYLSEFKIKGNEIVPSLCPFCQGGQHRDRSTFALNMVNHTYNCKRGSCGKQGHFSELCKEKGEKMDDDGNSNFVIPPSKKQYKKSETSVRTPTDKVTQYIKSRKISDDTITKFGVGSGDDGNIVFPFYRTGKDFADKTPTFAKFRKPEKLGKGERKMWREAGTEPILFGLHLCQKDGRPLVITEGEFDCMAVYEATKGTMDVVSVPSGSEDFTWIETCQSELEEYRSVYIFGDNDSAGKKMIAEINAKLSDKKIYAPDFKYYGDCKDANELYYKGGSQAITNAIKGMSQIPTAGLLNLADVRSIDLTQVERTMTGIPTIDKLTGGMLAGDLTVWTGKRGGGKSTFLNQFSIDAVNQGKKVCIYSGEVPADRLKYWINLCAAGKTGVESKIDRASGREVYYVKSEIERKIEMWYDEKLWVYDNKIIQTDERESILSIFTAAYRRYDCRMFIVDNLMTVQIGVNAREVMQIQADFIIKLRKFAEKYGVHVHVVVHPRKVNGEVDDNDEVGGMATITNIACNVFAVARIPEEKQSDYGCNAKIKCMKNRAYGDEGDVRLNFNVADRRFTEVGGYEKVYGWNSIGFPDSPEEPPF